MLKNDFYKLNDEKTTLEVCLILFKKCNLNCQFCFQDRSSINIDYIKQIPENLKSPLQETVLKLGIKSVVYRIWGGELFSDDIDDKLFFEYQELVDKLILIGNDLGIKTKICFTSNLVFKNINRVKNLLEATNSVLATSYDPIYRFHNEGQINLWEENVNIFKPETISITLTKQNIQKYINEPIHFQRFKNFVINLEYYIYNKKYDFFKPSEEDLYNFYLFCHNHKTVNIPEMKAIDASLNNPIGRYCSCDKSCLYIDGKITFNCLKRSSNLPIEQFFDKEPIEDEYTEKQLQLGLKRKNCLVCKNYSFCRMTCLASILHKSFDGSNCALKRYYDYLRKEQNGK